MEEDLSVALVYAEISGQFFGDVERRHPDRVVNVGIREQLLLNVGAGLALSGMRPVVHTFASFLVERAFEQVKLGFGHQDVGGVLVGSGGSFDASASGAHPPGTGDVALLDTLDGWTVHVPGHPRRWPGRCGRRSPVTGAPTCGWCRSRTPSRGRSPLAASRSYGAGRARPCSRSGRCSTRCWPRSRGAT